MVERSHYASSSGCGASSPQGFPAASGPWPHALHSGLVELDIGYERERERLLQDKHLKLRRQRLQTLEEQPRQRRAPYMKQLAMLHESVRRIPDDGRHYE
jgi:hypothetical protein